MSFKILTLSNNLSSLNDGVFYEWRKYNPNNIDVVELKKRWYNTGNIHKIPSEFKAWIDCFYMNRTPSTNYENNIELFASNSGIESLLEEFPKIYRSPYNPFVSSVKAMIIGTQDKWLRLLLFEFLKDWCLEEFAARYFIEKNGNYANTTANSEAMKWGCVNAELVFKYLYDKFKNKPAPSDWKAYIGQGLQLVASVISIAYPPAATIALPLALLLTQTADKFSTIKYDPETGQTSIYKSDGSLLYEKAGIGGTDWGTIALIGAGAFMIYSMSKKRGTK